MLIINLHIVGEDKVSGLPRVRITKHYGKWPPEETICEFEQAKDLLANYFPSERWAGALVSADGQLVRSYDELVQVAKHSSKSKQLIEVGIYPQAGGG